MLTNKIKKQVLFATTNPAKIKKYTEKLKEKGIEVLTIKDLGINLKPEETGKNAIENAYIKAKAYYDKTKITTIGMDNNLFIEELPQEKQPGTYVRIHFHIDLYYYILRFQNYNKLFFQFLVCLLYFHFSIFQYDYFLVLKCSYFLLFYKLFTINSITSSSL